MPLQTEKDLSDNARSLWLKARSAIEVRNHGYAISLLQAVLKEAPGFLDGRRQLRVVEFAATKGKKGGFLSGLSGMKSSGMVKKDPLAAMEMAEKNLETDPGNAPANHMLKDAAKGAGYPEVAAFALETLMQVSPKDTKVMHELGEHYLSMGAADKAVDVYSRIAQLDPADLIAVKRSKDAAATDSMKSGGWTAVAESGGKKDYRDLIKNKDEAISLEQKNRVFKDIDMIDQQLSELHGQWEQAQDSVDFSRRMAKLYEDRHQLEPSVETIGYAVWYYEHTNSLVSGSDPGVARKLSDLGLKKLELQIKEQEDYIGPTEAWLAENGPDVEGAAEYQQAVDDAKAELQRLKTEREEMLVAEAKKRVERNPTDLQLRFELGERLLAAGNFTDAIPELQRARQNPNARLRAMSLLGRCFVLKGMYDMAANQFRSAAAEMIAMDPVKKDTLYELGLVLEKMGKLDESVNCMKEIMEADYGYKDVAQRVESSYAT